MADARALLAAAMAEYDEWSTDPTSDFSPDMYREMMGEIVGATRAFLAEAQPEPIEDPAITLRRRTLALEACETRLIALAAPASGIEVRQLQAALHSTLPDDGETHTADEEPFCEYLAVYLTESLADAEARELHEARLVAAYNATPPDLPGSGSER